MDLETYERAMPAMCHPPGPRGLWALLFLGHVFHSFSTSLWFWGKCLKLYLARMLTLGLTLPDVWGPVSTVVWLSSPCLWFIFMRTSD